MLPPLLQHFTAACQFAVLRLRRLRVAVEPRNPRPVTDALVNLTRSKAVLIAENALLRQQLLILRRSIPRRKRRRIALAHDRVEDNTEVPDALFADATISQSVFYSVV